MKKIFFFVRIAIDLIWILDSLIHSKRFDRLKVNAIEMNGLGLGISWNGVDDGGRWKVVGANIICWRISYRFPTEWSESIF